MIFRKVADVRREKELAERRKNEPQLDQNQDHLVRKIFSKFRRDRALQAQASQSQSPTPAPDLEKGEKEETMSDGGMLEKRLSICASKLSNVTEADSGSSSSALVTVSKPVARPTTIRASKWGRLLGSSVDSGSETTAASSRPASGRDSPAKSSGSGNGNGSSAGGSGNKVFPKLQKVTAAGGLAPPQMTRQDTIEEIVEFEERQTRATNLRKFDSCDSGIIRSDHKLNESFRPPTAGTPAEYKEIMTNIMDFKVDVKLEVQRLNQKISRMEEMLCEVLSRLGSHSPSSASQGPESGPEGSVKSSRPQGSSDVGSVILRKRRSKSRTKATAPAAPVTRTSDPEPDPEPSSPPPQPPPTSHSAPGRIDEDTVMRPYPRRPREFL